MKTCELICNLESGKGIREWQLKEIVKKLERGGYKTNLYITKARGDAKNHVKELPHRDLVLSIGGDGTFNEIVSGNYERDKKLVLSHIPLGTTNDIGHMLGLNKNIIRSVQKILDGEVKQVDLGIVNGKPFVYVAGFGKFINVPYQTSRRLKKRLGHMAYLLNGVKEFFQTTKLYDVEYKIDDKVYKGNFSLILISNANRIAGFSHIYRDVKLDDDKFEIMFCDIHRKRKLVKTLVHIIKTGITNAPGIYCHTANKIEITFKEKVKNNWTVDGEKLDDENNKYTFTIDKNLKLLLPKKNLKKLFIK